MSECEALCDRIPPCPGCGLTSQVEPSRSEPGRWMCHGCAQPFDALGPFIAALKPDVTIEGIGERGPLAASAVVALRDWWDRRRRA